MLDQTYYKKADEIISQHGLEPASLIPIIQDIQSEYRSLTGTSEVCGEETWDQ